MDLPYTKEEKLKQVDDLQAETNRLSALMNTYYEQIKHSESSIKSILETISKVSYLSIESSSAKCKLSVTDFIS